MALASATTLQSRVLWPGVEVNKTISQKQHSAGDTIAFVSVEERSFTRRSHPRWPNQRSSSLQRSSRRQFCPTKASAAPPEGAERMKGWSNPSGQPLREIIPCKLWAAERPFIWYGIDVGGRMAVVRLDDGSLWVHSPVPLVPSLKEEIDKLGTLRYVVSPNYEHCGFAQQWVDAYPTALAYACPGLVEKRPDIKYSKTVGDTDEPPSEWNGEFEFAWLDCEHNPFNRQPFFNEVVFFHKPSKALFVSDLFWNYPSKEAPFTTWLWKQGMDRVYLPFYKKFMLYRRDRFYQQLERIENWNWETLVPCHGDVVLSQAKAALSKHLT